MEATAALVEKIDSGAYDAPDQIDSPAETVDAGAQSAPDAAAASGSRDDKGRFVKGSAPEAAPAAPPAPGDAQQAAPAPKLDEPDKPVEGEIDPDKPETWLPANRIPYQRFKSVLDARKAAEQRAATLEQELATARAVKPMFDAMAQQRQQPAAHDLEGDDLLAEIFGEQQSAVPEYVQPIMRQMQAMQAELAQFKHQAAVQEASRRLDAELAAVAKDYPDVAEEDILDHVRLHGSKADIRGFVEARQERVNAIKAQGVKEYLAAQARRAPTPSVPVAAPSVPPRPPTAVSAASPSGVMRGELNLTNEAQRREYLRQKFPG